MRALGIVAAAALSACGGGGGYGGGDDGGGNPPPPGGEASIGHVFIIVLENKSFDETFGENSAAPYLSQTLRSQGLFLPQYYGTAHLSLGNYIAMVSGQGPNFATQSDCQFYLDFAPPVSVTVLDQIVGTGCVYPPVAQTVVDQLEGAGFSWRGYMEDMGNDPVRDGGTTCAHPPLNARDPTQSAAADDQYAVRHNPFMYFHSIVDDQERCDAHVVPLTELPADLAGNTPNYVFITPNLCNDGHDTDCENGDQGGLISADAFLQTWVPRILASPAFQQDGLLIITFDEAEAEPNDPTGSDASACCGEGPGPNAPLPGIFGLGGGRVGAVLLSPFITAGTTDETPYNHYSMLRSVENFFGLEPLGYAGGAGIVPFASPAVFNRPIVPAQPPQ